MSLRISFVPDTPVRFSVFLDGYVRIIITGSIKVYQLGIAIIFIFGCCPAEIFARIIFFASKEYDPGKDFSWATPEYKNYGYAELIDLYATGNYYTDITIEEYRKTNRSIWNETDSQAQSGTWYCVEGSCQHLRQILKGNKFMGGILVDQFYDNPAKLSETIEMNLRRSDGLMVFDIVHIITKNLWKEVEEGMKRGGSL